MTRLVGSAYRERTDEKYNRGRREYWLKTGCLIARDGHTDKDMRVEGLGKPYVPWPPGQRMGPLWPQQARKIYTGQPGFELNGEESDGSSSTSSG